MQEVDVVQFLQDNNIKIDKSISLGKLEVKNKKMHSFNNVNSTLRNLPYV